MMHRLKEMLVWIAGGALLVAVAVDTLAMVGRQIKVPLIGSIEIVEAVVLIAAAGALVLATLEGAHARVNLVRDNLSVVWRSRTDRVYALTAVLLFAALLAGTIWIAADLWNGHEESELLRLPYKPLRLVTAAALATLLVIALRRLLRRESS